MLKQLVICNAILIEHASLSFLEGLNIITGETGAGKSAVLQALRLLSGERYDSSILRYGEEKGWVEASFELQSQHFLNDVLENHGLTPPEDNLYILRREFNAAGKSRCFINHQLAQRNLLEKISPFLFQIVSQHASQDLLEIETHRRLLDEYAGLKKETENFALLWRRTLEQERELEELLKSEQERFRNIETLRNEIDELNNAHIKVGEEEELFAEYTLLSNSETLTNSCQEILQLLQETPHSALVNLSKVKRIFDRLQSLEISISESRSHLDSVILEIEEIVYSVTKLQNRVENNPQRTEEINSRLSYLNQLKKRYGSDINHVLEYLANATQRFNSLENCHSRIDELKQRIEQSQKELDKQATELTQERTIAAEKMSKALTHELRELNIPHAEVSVRLVPSPRSSGGDQQIEIYFKPNQGEKIIPIKQCASGGEISRILLALYSIQRNIEFTPTLIFDEIDANIGGETAVLVGKKMREIRQQVISVTHFPQIASQAHHHILIAKQEDHGRTLTTIFTLSKEEIKKELRRMSGESCLHSLKKDIISV